MLIRPTSILAHSIIDGDARTFSHSLNQEIITDIDCMIPITHKNQLTQINRKDLSPGMSAWSAYYRDWLTSFDLDYDYLRQGITRYRSIDDDTGTMYTYWFKGSSKHLDNYNHLLTQLQTGLYCGQQGRFIQIGGGTGSFHPAKTSNNIDQALSNFLGLVLVYGLLQVNNSICSNIKLHIPITSTTRSAYTQLIQDIDLLRKHGLFVSHHLSGEGIKQQLELVCNDPEIIQMLLIHLQYIDSSITMTTLATLQARSAQVIELGLTNQTLIAKPRSL